MTAHTFEEASHPRETTGRFIHKTNSAPVGTLAAPAAADVEDATAERVEALRNDYFELWSDRAADVEAALHSAGEVSDRQAELATQTRDPRVLAILAQNTIGDVDEMVARNPVTPASVLHHIATDTSADRRYESRYLATAHANTDPATIRHLWEEREPDEKPHVRRALAVDLAFAQNTPPDILTAMIESGNAMAGTHPALPADTITAALTDVDRAHLVVQHPSLTAEQLDLALQTVEPLLHSEDEDDEIRGVLVATNVARHPSTAARTLQALEHHPDPWVRKTVRDRRRGESRLPQG